MRSYLFLLILLTTFSLTAQNETINWYFGNKAGLKFDKGSLEVLFDSEMVTPAGSSSISDENGDLLFYTNGQKVWNKNHVIMEDGEGLYGEKESTQSALIVKKPNFNPLNTTNEYYIFHPRKTKTDSAPIMLEYMNYSVVEISPAHPLGKVTLKNRTLNFTNTGKITAVHHKNGKDIWVVFYGSAAYASTDQNYLYAYKITETGIPLLPTKSYRLGETNPSKGEIKFSPDGKKIAVSGIKNAPFPRLDLYDFNNETGEITYNVGVQVIIGLFIYYDPYGLSFSPNSKLLYYSAALGNTHHIIQVDIAGLSTTGLEPEVKSIFSSNSFKLGTLQLAPDGNIYVAKSMDSDENPKSIGFIDNPDEFERDPEVDAKNINTGRRLREGVSKMGLPNFVQSYFASRIETENTCVGNAIAFTAKSYTDIDAIVWNFGDGNTSNEINPNHIYATSGDKVIEAKLALSNNQVISIYKKITVHPLPVVIPDQDLIQYDDDFDGLSTLNLFNSEDIITDNPKLLSQLIFYKTEGDLRNDVRIENPESYKNSTATEKIYVKLISNFGCESSTNFNIKVVYAELDPISDIFSCENETSTSTNAIGTFRILDKSKEIIADLNLTPPVDIQFYNSRDDANKRINHIRKYNQYEKATGLIWVRVEGPDGGIQKFNAIVNPKPVISVQNEYTICYDPTSKPPVILNVDTSNHRVEWKNSIGGIISTDFNYTLNSVGEFSLTAYKTENGIECSNTKTFVVNNPEAPTFFDIDVNTEDETNNIISFIIDGNSTYEYSLDNINFVGNGTSYTFTNVTAGLRTIYVRDANGCEQPLQKTVSVIGFKTFFTPNGDGKNDYWNINGLDKASFKSFYVHIFDRYGKLITSIVDDFTTLGWNGTYNGKLMQANNYWFRAEIIDNNDNIIRKTGNFSLIGN